MIYLPEYNDLKLDQLYRSLDFFQERINQGDSCQAIFDRTADLFNTDVDVIFYDTTSAYFEMDEEDGEGEDGFALRKHGYSKDGKANRPQIGKREVNPIFPLTRQAAMLFAERRTACNSKNLAPQTETRPPSG